MPATRFAALALAALTAPAAAQLYTEDFESDPTADWTVNNGPSDANADFFFDYSTVGIPSAPSGGGTRGLKLQANLTNGIFSGLSVSPTARSFSGNYTLRFDWWSNINGPFPAGGNGSTNLSTFGIGTAGTSPLWPGAGPGLDAVMFAATGDGGSASDWRAYSTAEPFSYASGDPVYSAATNNSSDPYFAAFGNLAAPAAQTALFPQQTGNTVAGSAAFAWHDVIIEKSGDTATWTVNGLLIATIDLNTVTLAGGNIFFGHSDTNAGSSNDPNDAALLFTLIDNIRVVPTPAAPTLLALAALATTRRRR